jgi:penicillin-binding protein 1A
MSFLSKWKQTIKQLPAKTKKMLGGFFLKTKTALGSFFSAAGSHLQRAAKSARQSFRAKGALLAESNAPKGAGLSRVLSGAGRFFRRTGAFLAALALSMWAFLRALFEKPAPKQTAPSSLGETVVYSKEELQKAQKAAYRAKKSGGVAVSSTRSGLKAKRKQTAQPADDGSIFQPRTKRPNIVLSILVTIIRICVVLVLLAGVAVAGSLIGVAKAYTDAAPELDITQIEDQAETSFIYDGNGDLITTFAGVENREWATIEEIPEMLQNAFIAIEDVRFRSHNGVDLKRLMGAFVSNFVNENVEGASTITQQLIKQRVLTSERTYKRKIQEAYLAIQLEQTYTKNQILEAYLNTISLGESNYGVKAAAQDYFGKDLEDLSLLECATLAGLTQNPNTYNPRKNFFTRDTPELTMNRTKTVLQAMYRAGFITDAQYQEALSQTLVVQETSNHNEMYNMPYFVEYAIDDVITNFLEVRNLPDTKQNRSAIENELRTGGYHIYTTVDPDIQNTVQDTLANWDGYPSMADSADSITKDPNGDGTYTETVQPQAAAVVLDYHTGELKAIVGGRYTPTAKKTFNRASDSAMMVGSSIKPLSVYGPALDKGYGAGTIQYNIPVTIPGWDATGEQAYPGGSGPYTPVSIRTAIVRSLNIVSARTLMDFVTVQEATNYLINLGVDESHINEDGQGLALGTSGLTPLEMAVGFGTIANSGQYISPTSFEKVLDKDGNVLLDSSALQKQRQVYKESTAWMLTDMLTDAVNSGTGTAAQISGMTVAGKTGTTSQYRGTFFAGYTPYYAATVWIGSDKNAPLAQNTYASTSSAPLWQAFMSKIHEGLEDKAIIDKTPEELGLVKVAVCPVSGKLATEACNDEAHGLSPVYDYFLDGTQPTEYCDMHTQVEICTESGKLASEYCPEETRLTLSILKAPSNTTLRPEDLAYLYSLYNTYTDADGNQIQLGDLTGEICDIHTEEWAAEQEDLQQLILDSYTLIARVQFNLAQYGSQLTENQLLALNQSTEYLDSLLKETDVTIENIQKAKDDLEQLSNRFFEGLSSN